MTTPKAGGVLRRPGSPDAPLLGGPGKTRRGRQVRGHLWSADNRKRRTINKLLIDDRPRHLWRLHPNLGLVTAGRVPACPGHRPYCGTGAHDNRDTRTRHCAAARGRRGEGYKRVVIYGDPNEGKVHNVNSFLIDDRRCHQWAKRSPMSRRPDRRSPDETRDQHCARPHDARGPSGLQGRDHTRDRPWAIC
jgi:hypothetical protein